MDHWCIDWVREPLCEPNILCIFVLRITSEPRVKFVDSKSALIVYVLRRWSWCYSYFLCGIVVFSTGRFMLSLALIFVLVFFSVLFKWSPRLGKRVKVYMLLMLLFVYFARIKFCPFSLPLCVRVGRRVLVTLPGLFYYLFSSLVSL